MASAEAPPLATAQTRVLHLFVAPARGAPMRAQETVLAIAHKGLAGDRYADPAIGRRADNQVTLIEAEHIASFAASTGYPLTPDMPRRNIVTSGVRLNDLRGQRFTIGGAEFEGLELCEPCRLFAARTFSEVLPFFVGKGGLRARVVSGGDIRIGDALLLSASASAHGD